LTDLCGLPAPAGLDGRSLTPWLRNPELPTAKPAVALWNRGQRAVRTDRWRLIAHPATAESGGKPAYELFDFAQGTAEAVNLADALPQVVEQLVPLLPRSVE
jgi:arylsulfatase A-like enzyme